MREIEILKEGDLPYFEELEREGKAVILRFSSLEEFSRFDLPAYLGEKDKKPLELEDVKEWLLKEHEKLSQCKDKNAEFVERINKLTDLIEKYILVGSAKLPERENVCVMAMIGYGISMEELKKLADPLLSLEERMDLIQEMKKKYTENKEE